MSRWTPRTFAAGRWPDSATWWQIINVSGVDVGSIWLEPGVERSGDLDLGIFIASPSARGHGIGTRAIELALEAAARRQAPWVRLRVREANVAAIRCYERVGFAVTARGIKQIDGRDIPFLHMAKPLA